MFLKIKSQYIFHQLFSFISEKRKFKLIKYNLFINKKLDLSIKNYKEFFFQTKIEEYDNYSHIYNYWMKFQNDFQNIIDENSYNLFISSLSKKKDFILKLFDKEFNRMINDSYFQNNISVEIEDMDQKLIPKILLIKDNKLTNKTQIILKEIFDKFASNGKMYKVQLLEFMKKIKRNDDDNINDIFLYDIDNEGFLLFENFIKYYYDLIKTRLYLVWNDLNYLGYNIFLEKKKTFDLDYLQIYINDFPKTNLFNFFQIINKKIIRMRLCSKIDKIFIEYLNIKHIFLHLKKIEISINNLILFIELNIICPNIEELSLYINEDLNFNKKQMIYIFKNIITLKLYIKNNIDLITLMNELMNSKLQNLEIFNRNKEYINQIIDSKIILKTIKKIIIDGNLNIFILLINNIQFPNLEEYQLNLSINSFSQNIREIKNIDKNDFNLINCFLIQLLKNRNKFLLKNFIDFPNKIKNINYLKINLKFFSFIYNKINGKNNYFEFKLYDDIKFKNYYSNYDISIDEKEISKYKQIKIEGLNKLIQRTDCQIEIIENKKINLCDLNIINVQRKYYIKCLKEIRSIYCEDEIQNENLISIIKDIINKKGFQKLKYINLNIGYMKKSSNDKNILNIYNYLSELIRNCKNLKSLIVKLNDNENISFFLSLIENLKKIKIVNITSKIDDNNLNEGILLNKFPKLKKRKYYFKEFKINKTNYIECIYEIKKLGKEIQLLNYVKQNYKDFSLYYDRKEEEMEEFFELYLNDNKIDFCFKNEFKQKKQYKIKIQCLKLITNMNNIFSHCSSLISLNLSNLNTNIVTDMSRMFYNCSSLTFLNLKNLKTHNVTNMEDMFSECSSLISLDLSNFNTYNVTNMSGMFYNCSSLISLDLSSFNTFNVFNMNHMFSHCSSLISLNLSNFETINVSYMIYIFSFCNSLSFLDIPNFNTNNVINMIYMFSNCFSLTSLNLSIFNTNNVTDMSNMFYFCSSLNSLNLSNFNVENVINMKNMFSSCSSLVILDLSNFNTINVSNMSYMFNKCTSLTSLNISNFNTINVINMQGMFSECVSLNFLNLSNFNTINVINMSYMFNQCTSLTSLNLSNFNTINAINMRKMFYECSSLNYLDISNFNVDDITDIHNIFYALNKNCNIITSNNNLLEEYKK